jgi:hypothetical protein
MKNETKRPEVVVAVSPDGKHVCATEHWDDTKVLAVQRWGDFSLIHRVPIEQLEDLDQGAIVGHAMVFAEDKCRLLPHTVTGEEMATLRARILRSNVHHTPGTLNNQIMRMLNDLDIARSIGESYDALRRAVLAYERNPTGYQFEELQSARKRLDEADESRNPGGQRHLDAFDQFAERWGKDQ